MGKAIGIGGVFIKYADEKAMKTWFETALGLTCNDYGVLFTLNDGQQPKAYLQLGTFPKDSNYFGKMEQQVMINFRVTDLVGLEQHLRSLGTTICDTIESYEYGKFLHIEDPEGNRIELWEPIDASFDEENQQSM